MTAINSVSSVYICADSVTFTGILPEDICFVGTCVGSKDGVFVDVVCVGAISAGMVCRKTQRVEVLGYGHDGGEIIMVFVRRRREA